MRFQKYLRVHGRLAGRRAWHILKRLVFIPLQMVGDIILLLVETLDKGWRSHEDDMDATLARKRQACTEATEEYIHALKNEVQSLNNLVKAHENSLQHSRKIRDITELQYQLTKYVVDYHIRHVGPVSAPPVQEQIQFIEQLDISRKVKDDILREYELIQGKQS